MKIAIIGMGSIGKRHAKNLIHSGHEIIIIESDINKSSRLKQNGCKVYGSLSDCEDSFQMAIVCTPTQLHIPIAQSLALRKGIKGIFIEKPLSYNMDGVKTLFSVCAEQNIRIGSACNMKYLNGIHLVKILLSSQAIGTVYHAQYFFGHDLRKWNDRDYKCTYSAGEHGGILLDDSHSIYLCEDLFGSFKHLKGNLHRIGTLDIQNEDCSNIITTTDQNISVSIHSDYLCPDYTRNIEIYGTGGTIQYEMIKETNLDMMVQYVHLKTPAIQETRTFCCSEPMNEMYVHEMDKFIQFVTRNIDTFHTGLSEIELITKLKIENKERY
jgi:predicted dehydrogenase